MAATDFAWTPEITTEVVNRFDAGESAAQIAKDLSQRLRTTLSRNSIIGRIHRAKARSGGVHTLRVPREPVKRHTYPTKPLPDPKPAKPAKLRVWKGNVVEAAPDCALPAPAAVDPHGVPLDEVPRGGCKFAVSPHTTNRHLFCSAPVADPSVPYCRKHLEICVAPQQPRRLRPHGNWDLNVRASR